jgi:putative spermidine/putrescine transport system permease protein
MLKQTKTALLLLAAPGAAITFAFILPMVQVGWWSFFDSDGFTVVHIAVVLTDQLFVTVLLRTIILSVQVAGISVLIGYPIAYYLSTMSGPTQRICILLITFPLWVSVLVRTYSWIVVLGREGLINLFLTEMSIINEPLKLIFTRGAVLVASVQVLVPLAILIMFGAMSQINRTLLHAARVLGAPPHRAFLWVFLPLSLNGVISAAILVFVLSLGFYITPALVGGPRDIMVSNVIAQQINQTLDWALGAALGVVLLGAGLLVAAGIYLIFGRFAASTAEGGMRS